MRLPTFYEQNLIPNWGIYLITILYNNSGRWIHIPLPIPHL